MNAAITMWGLEIQTASHHLHEVYFNSTLAKERFLRDLRPALAGFRVIGAEDRPATAHDVLAELRDQLSRDRDEETQNASNLASEPGARARRERDWSILRADVLDGVLSMLDQAERITQ